MAGGSVAQMFQSTFIHAVARNMTSMMARVDQKDLLIIKDYIESGKIRPFIDKRYPLTETAAALWYLKNGYARGKVVITVP
jgi:NADPH:quinone reductase-like Zn-dependent oxidoreductase